MRILALVLVLSLLPGAAPAQTAPRPDPARPDSGAAGPDRLSLLAVARHVDPKSDFERVVPGVFLTWEGIAGGPLDLSAGLYRNSYARRSVALALAWPVWRRDEAQVDLFLGAALYPEDGRRFAVHLGDVVPIGGVQLRWRSLFAQVIPSDGVETDAIVTLGVSIPLGR